MGDFELQEFRPKSPFDWPDVKINVKKLENIKGKGTTYSFKLEPHEDKQVLIRKLIPKLNTHEKLVIENFPELVDGEPPKSVEAEKFEHYIDYSFEYEKYKEKVDVKFEAERLPNSSEIVEKLLEKLETYDEFSDDDKKYIAEVKADLENKENEGRLVHWGKYVSEEDEASYEIKAKHISKFQDKARHFRVEVPEIYRVRLAEYGQGSLGELKFEFPEDPSDPRKKTQKKKPASPKKAEKDKESVYDVKMGEVTESPFPRNQPRRIIIEVAEDGATVFKGKYLPILDSSSENYLKMDDSTKRIEKPPLDKQKPEMKNFADEYFQLVSDNIPSFFVGARAEDIANLDLKYKYSSYAHRFKGSKERAELSQKEHWVESGSPLKESSVLEKMLLDVKAEIKKKETEIKGEGYAGQLEDEAVREWTDSREKEGKDTTTLKEHYERWRDKRYLQDLFENELKTAPGREKTNPVSFLINQYGQKIPSFREDDTDRTMFSHVNGDLEVDFDREKYHVHVHIPMEHFVSKLAWGQYFPSLKAEDVSAEPRKTPEEDIKETYVTVTEDIKSGPPEPDDVTAQITPIIEARPAVYDNHEEVAKDIKEKTQKEPVTGDTKSGGGTGESERLDVTLREKSKEGKKTYVPFTEDQKVQAQIAASGQPQAQTEPEPQPEPTPEPQPASPTATPTSGNAGHKNPKVNIYSILKGKGGGWDAVDSKKAYNSCDIVDHVLKDSRFIYRALIDVFESSLKFKEVRKGRSDKKNARLPVVVNNHNYVNTIKDGLEKKLEERFKVGVKRGTQKFSHLSNILVNDFYDNYKKISGYLNTEEFKGASSKDLFGRRKALLIRGLYTKMIETLAEYPEFYTDFMDMKDEAAIGIAKQLRYNKAKTKVPKPARYKNPKNIVLSNGDRKGAMNKLFKGGTVTMGKKGFYIPCIDESGNVDKKWELSVGDIYHDLGNAAADADYVNRTVSGLVKTTGYARVAGLPGFYEDKIKELGVSKRAQYLSGEVPALLFLAAGFFFPGFLAAAGASAAIAPLTTWYRRRKMAKKRGYNQLEYKRLGY